VADSTGEGVGKEEGLTGARFVAGDEAERRPVAARSGGRRWSFYSGGGEAPAVVSNNTGRWCGVMWSC
jgi:hypothetical protein